jgi:hypothetical protein
MPFFRSLYREEPEDCLKEKSDRKPAAVEQGLHLTLAIVDAESKQHRLKSPCGIIGIFVGRGFSHDVRPAK